MVVTCDKCGTQRNYLTSKICNACEGYRDLPDWYVKKKMNKLLGVFIETKGRNVRRSRKKIGFKLGYRKIDGHRIS